MKRLLALIGFLVASQVWAGAGKCPEAMPADVEAKLLPVLTARDEAARKNDWWDKSYEEAFGTLLAANDPASKQARVALMDYYVGEAFGEELVCAVALDGTEMVSLLKLYSQCDIAPSKSAVPRNRTLPLRTYALEMLKAGHVKESCTYE